METKPDDVLNFQPAEFEEQGGKAGGPGFIDVPIAKTHGPNGEPQIVSCWEPSAEALEQLQETGKLWLIFGGSLFPPVILTTRFPFVVEQAAEEEWPNLVTAKEGEGDGD